MNAPDERALLEALRVLVDIVDAKGGDDIGDRKEFWAVIWQARDMLRFYPPAEVES